MPQRRRLEHPLTDEPVANLAESPVADAPFIHVDEQTPTGAVVVGHSEVYEVPGKREP